jgi:DNA uptake protein ComE-like DNA-binding protein
MNGKFESLEQLKTLKPVTEEVYNKIEPYLIVK